MYAELQEHHYQTLCAFSFRKRNCPSAGASKSEVNDFLRAFDKCESLSYPLPPGITNYGIAELVYGFVSESGGRNENIEYPDYEADAKLMATRKNMTLVFLWNRYSKKCAEEGKRFYQYRQYCIIGSY